MTAACVAAWSWLVGERSSSRCWQAATCCDTLCSPQTYSHVTPLFHSVSEGLSNRKSFSIEFVKLSKNLFACLPRSSDFAQGEVESARSCPSDSIESFRSADQLRAILYAKVKSP